MQTRKIVIGQLLITTTALIAVAVALMQAPLTQDLRYHSFSDTRTLLAIPNLLNVASNLPFLIVGLHGLYKLTRKPGLRIIESNRLAYITLFLGTALVALGSGYYHLWPDNNTLVWDRLPMTIAFMALFAIVLSEFISEKLGKTVLLPFLGLGLASVVYWYVTESAGVGDLRYYVIVQFFPMLTIPIILICYESKFTHTTAYWLLLGAYLLAKVTEHFDAAIFDLLGVVSGHSIKHIAAALGLYLLLKAYEQRNPIPTIVDAPTHGKAPA